MLAEGVLLKVAEWAAGLFQAARNREQERMANVLSHASTLTAGVRYLDRSYTELLGPMAFYNPDAWTKDERVRRVEEIKAFLLEPKVIPRLATSLYWLVATEDIPVDLAYGVRELESIAVAGVWGQYERDALDLLHPPGIWDDGAEVPTLTEKDAVNRAIATWRDLAHSGGAWMAAMRHELERQPDMIFLQTTDPLFELMQSDDPDPDLVREEALRLLQKSSPMGSPLRPYADRAEMEFVSLLIAAQRKFPAIPQPSWLFEL